MSDLLSRRSFLEATAAGAALALLPRGSAQGGEFTGKIRKAVKYHMIAGNDSPEDKLKMLKDLGFDGVEPKSSLHPSADVDPRALARASEKVGLPVHGIVNSSGTKLQDAIDEAKRYGATSVLTTIPKMPRGDESYLANYHQTQDILKRASEYAEKQQIHILIENVWASFIVDPVLMARYVDEIDSPYVQVYFDIGNCVRWGWPQHWLEVLGPRAVKLDIKEFDMDVAMNEGMRKGFDTPIGEGSIEWNLVRAQLATNGYQGWATAEVSGGDRQHLADIAARMNRVLDL